MATANLDISEKLDIVVKRGDSMDITLKLTEENGSPTDVSNYTWSMSVKDKRVESGRTVGVSTPVVYESTILTTSNTIDTTEDGVGGIISPNVGTGDNTNEVTFSASANVMTSIVPGTYVYDIQYINGAEVKTILEGLFIVNPDVAFVNSNV